MNRMKYWYFILSLVFVFGCSDSGPVDQEDETADWYSYSGHYDGRSATYYYLTRIQNKDSQGNLKRLKLAMSERPQGEEVRRFALRSGATLAFNASMGIVDSDPLAPVGIQIIDGEVVQDIINTQSWRYTLGVKADNELVAYVPGTTPEQMLADGVVTATSAFIPLIENFEAKSESFLEEEAQENAIQKHPRQIIAQMENLDIVFLSCGGRGFDGDGMLAVDVIRILENEGVKFAYMLDGGGSTSTVINGRLITKMIDNNGTRERLRPNFLYFD